jgi:hypothetical protein
MPENTISLLPGAGNGPVNKEHIKQEKKEGFSYACLNHCTGV